MKTRFRSCVATMIVTACGTGSPPVQTATSSGASPPAVAAAAVELTPADVTMVWPMPADEAQRDSMLAATSQGKHGELLPLAMYQAPVLDERDFAVKDPKVDHGRLRVVAARLDPCFASFAPPQDLSCVNQVRLVLQAIRPGGGTVQPAGPMGANDGAVHLFYKLSRQELLDLSRSLAALRDKHGGSESSLLGVHPALARAGLGSAYAKQLQELLLSQIGARRLTRVTFFARTAAREPLWPFGIFDVVDGKLEQQTIVTTDTKRQTLEGAGPRKVVEPSTQSKDNPNALLSLMGPKRAPSPAERAAFAAVLRIQHPAKHTPETIACVECHAAQRMQSAAEKTLGLTPAEFGDDYFEPTIAPPERTIDAENFHSCGYLGTNLAISTRTANETAAVVAAMNALLGG
jgi:hypothetical protein